MYIETELVAKSESQGQEISLLEGVVMSLREELNRSQARVDELTSQNSATEAEKIGLESRLQEFSAERKKSETNVLDELQQQKSLSNQKGDLVFPTA